MTISSKFIFLGVIAAGIFFFTGCGAVNRASASWTVHVDNGPWDRSGQHSKLESRQYWPSLMAAGMSSDERLVTSDRKYINANRLIDRSIDFLEEVGYLDAWPQTQSYIYPNKRPQVVAPYKFYFVSVDPAVVILVSHDYGPTLGRSNYDIIGDAPQPNRYFLDSRILNRIQIETVFPDAEDFYWFSPELNVRITKIEQNPNGFIIEHPRISVRGTRNNNTIVTNRIR
jgi:hypothetical protein